MNMSCFYEFMLQFPAHGVTGRVGYNAARRVMVAKDTRLENKILLHYMEAQNVVF